MPNVADCLHSYQRAMFRRLQIAKTRPVKVRSKSCGRFGTIISALINDGSNKMLKT